MSDSDKTAHGGTEITCEMDDRTVLQIASLTNHNSLNISAQNTLIPHARGGSENDITQHDGTRRDPGGWMNARAFREVGADQIRRHGEENRGRMGRVSPEKP